MPVTDTVVYVKKYWPGDDSIRRSRSHPAPARGTAFRDAWRAACGPPKVRLVSCHNLGVNDLCVAKPMTYRAVEELAGRIKRGWWIVVNDHHRGYKAMPLAPTDRPYVCIWHPTCPIIILMMVTLDFELKNAPYFLSTFTASLLQQIQAWLGEDGYSMYYLDDNGEVCQADKAQPQYVVCPSEQIWGGH